MFVQLGNLVEILFVFSPSNTIMHYDKIKSDMVYGSSEVFVKPKIICYVSEAFRGFFAQNYIRCGILISRLRQNYEFVAF